MTTRALPTPLTELHELSIQAPEPAKSSDIAIRMATIERDLVERVGNTAQFSEFVGQLIRDAIDYVIDAPVLYRYSIEELDPDEKTAIGKRIERLLRFHLKLPNRNKLDVVLGGEDVDIKTTMHSNWMFSKSNLNHINLLIAYNEASATYKLGLAFVCEDQLGAENRDKKRSLTAKFKENIRWLFQDQSYPANYLARLPHSEQLKIFEEKSGAARVRQLLRSPAVMRTAIPRHAICCVANQKDALKGIRVNGGARGNLWREGILVLSGRSKHDRKIAEEASGIKLTQDETMSISRQDARVKKSHVRLYKTMHRLPE